MPNWRIAGQVCAAIGVLMSAMSTSLAEILPHPVDNVWFAIQTGVIAVGLYFVAQSTNPPKPAESESVSA